MTTSDLIPLARQGGLCEALADALQILEAVPFSSYDSLDVIDLELRDSLLSLPEALRDALIALDCPAP